MRVVRLLLALTTAAATLPHVRCVPLTRSARSLYHGSELEELPDWWHSGAEDADAGVGGRRLQTERPGQTAISTSGPHCGPLTKELIHSYAKENTVLVTVMDHLVWNHFGPSWVENVQLANITYWFVAALDPKTSLELGALGVKQCFNVPHDRLQYKGDQSGAGYSWGSHHWAQTTWNKVHVMRFVYELGTNIIHSDGDVVWFNDPLPYFRKFTNHTVKVLMATDMVTSYNPKGELDLEYDTSPYVNINTGVYWIKQFEGGVAFMDEWLSWQPKNVGHDQDGFNHFSRGRAFRGEAAEPEPIWDRAEARTKRYFFMAYSNTTALGFLPASAFGNAYTFVNSRLHDKLQVPLFEIHWVWGGSTLEAKRQNMRDAIRFHDPPEYYTAPNLLSFDLDQLPMPEGFNDIPDARTEDMIQFHVKAAVHQLRQVYYAFAMALVLNRTVVMPKLLCYCSKNWYMTQACRINNEKITAFPFVCALSQLMRVKRLEMGLQLPEPHAYHTHKVHIREYAFLDNPKVPRELKESVVTISPSAAGRAPGQPAVVVGEVQGLSPTSKKIEVAGPVTDKELIELLAPYKASRILHFTAPHKTFSRFVDEATHKAYDEAIQQRTTAWCCRSPADFTRMNVTDKLQLVMLPRDRTSFLPQLPAGSAYPDLG